MDHRGHRWTLRRRAQIVVLGLAVLVAGTGLVAVLAQRQVDRATVSVSGRWLPAALSLERLQKAYLDQQTGVRGYVLTGQDQFMGPFRTAEDTIPAEEQQLRDMLSDHPDAIQQLDAIVAAHRNWLDNGVRPQLGRIESGRLVEAQQVAATAGGPQRFEAVRVGVDTLRSTIGRQVDAASAAVSTVRNRMQVLISLTSVVGLLLAVVLLVGLRRGLLSPLEELVGSVSAVADGQLERAVQARGPREVATVAGAVERMRRALQRYTTGAVIAADREARLQEAERIAVQLHDVVISRVFGTSISVLSAANRAPETAAPLRAAVAELDEIVSELRAVVLGLAPEGPYDDQARQQLLDVAERARTALELDVVMRFDRAVDDVLAGAMLKDLTAALRDMLIDAAGRGTSAIDIAVEAPTTSTLCIAVSETPAGAGGDAAVRQLASRVGGRIVTPLAGGVDVLELDLSEPTVGAADDGGFAPLSPELQSG